MQKYITPYSIANEIRMLRSAISGSFLIVEGDVDARVYRNFTVTECQIKIAFGKSNAIEIIEILDNQNFAGSLAIIDTDFDFLNEVEKSNNIVSTDFHDLECLILSSRALEKVLSEFGSEEKIKKLGNTVIELVLEEGHTIGILRWISLSESLNLKFEELDYTKFINKKNLALDISELIKRVLINSKRGDINQNEVRDKIILVKEESHDKKLLSCGKDLIEILSIGLQKVFGTNNTNQVLPEIISRDLRLAYEYDFFVSTKLYSDVKKWENLNKPFRVFR